MTEAVIVATARSPIGRANKGSLVSLRPDDMSAQILQALLAKAPQVQASHINDVMWGIGQPAGEGGFNIARVISSLAGLDDVPGVTVNRYCSSSLQTIRMAFHAIKAGEGDCFIAGGVETVSRYASGASDMAPNPIFKTPGERTKARAQGGQGPWTPPVGLPDMYIAMGQTAENVVELEGISREEQDRFGVRSQNLAVAHVENGFFEREISPLTLEDGTVVSKDDGPRPGTTYEGVSQLKPGVPPRRHRHRRQCLPAQRRCRRRARDERHQGQGTRPHPAGPHRVQRRVGPQPRDHGPRPDRGHPQGARPWPARRSTRSTWSRSTRRSPCRSSARPSTSASTSTQQMNVHGGAIALGHPFGMTGARIMTTLINGLQWEDKTWGVESMCVGGGQGMAMVIERLSASPGPADPSASRPSECHETVRVPACPPSGRWHSHVRARVRASSAQAEVGGGSGETAVAADAGLPQRQQGEEHDTRAGGGEHPRGAPVLVHAAGGSRR
jgi:acetyl-CoA C-acetyltransferase